MPSASRPGVVLEVQLSGSAGAWTDIASDVLVTPGIRARYGIFGTGAKDRVADTGTLSFALNNSHTNSGGLAGYYSPGHANARSGFELGIGVRLGLTWSGSTFYKFRGWLDTILPEPGQRLGRRVYCTATDWMNEAAARRVRLLDLQENKRADEIIDAVVDTMTRKPAASALAIGQDVFPFALDNADAESYSPMGLFQTLMMSELGFLYVTGCGVLTFQDRHARPTSTSALTSLDDNMVDLVPRRGRSAVYNDVRVQVHPRRADAAASILYSLNSVPKLEFGEVLDLSGPYIDPISGTDHAGLLAACDLVPGTDFTLNTASAGNGIDRTSSASVSASFGATSWRATIAGVPDEINWLTSFRVTGRGLYTSEPLTLTASDAVSSACFGQSTLPFSAPAQDDANVGQSMADYLLQLYKDPQTRIEGVTFSGMTSDALTLAGLQREPGDRVSITETITGVSTDYYINAVALRVFDKNVTEFAWTLAPADPFQAWLIGVAGFGEIGQTTIVGY